MIVTREPEWDEASRQQALELQQYESGLCKCGCGRPAAESFDKTRKKPYVVDYVVCQAGRALEIVKRQHRDKAKASNQPDGWDDGRVYYVNEPEPEG